MGRCDDCEAWLTNDGMDLALCNAAPPMGLFSMVECEKVSELYHVHHEMRAERVVRCSDACGIEENRGPSS